jgi:predicted NBD/HSP70 family sugar kinase
VSLDWTGGVERPAPSRGTRQIGLRLYNERLALTLIRKHGSLPKAEIARLTGLSAQTLSVIVRQLEADELLVREIPTRGRVGQPSVPFKLNPDGAFSIGLKVGRRSGDLMLLDLTGKTRSSVHRPYDFPAPKSLLNFVSEGLDELLVGLSPHLRNRICGLGIAAPFELWNWEEEIGTRRDIMAAWRGFDLPGEISRLCEWPIHFCNDATAACAAELLFGQGEAYRDYAYFYIGYFAGGGIVINGNLYQGRGGNAGALGSFPIPGEAPARSQQLIRQASFHVLERELQKAKHGPEMLWRNAADWSAAEAELRPWIGRAAGALAIAAAGVCAVLECRAVVVDGAMPPAVRARLTEAVRKALADVPLTGISPFEIHEGSIGAEARVLGAASLPLFANFMIDRDILFKETS